MIAYVQLVVGPLTTIIILVACLRSSWKRNPDATYAEILHWNFRATAKMVLNRWRYNLNNTEKSKNRQSHLSVANILFSHNIRFSKNPWNFEIAEGIHILSNTMVKCTFVFSLCRLHPPQLRRNCANAAKLQASNLRKDMWTMLKKYFIWLAVTHLINLYCCNQLLLESSDCHEYNI